MAGGGEGGGEQNYELRDLIICMNNFYIIYFQLQLYYDNKRQILTGRSNQCQEFRFICY